MSLNELRKKIDSIDYDLLLLLNSRMKIVLELMKYKDDIKDSKREGEVFKNFSKIPSPIFNKKFSDKIFKEILKESKRIQKQK